MIKSIFLVLLTLASLINSVAEARTDRSAHEIKMFRATIPCPATGVTAKSCAGYIIDHVIPLCAGGPDRRTNMQWQTKADALKKDVLERRQCAALRKAAAK